MYYIVRDVDGNLFRAVDIKEADTVIVKPEDYIKDENAQYWALERRI